MRGEFDATRSLIGEANAILEELGGIYSAAMSHYEAFVEMLAGRPEAAEDRLRDAFERLEEMGGKELLATTAAMLAQAILAQDRLEEASHFCRASREAAGPEDLWSQVGGRGAYAKILARRGRGAEAERLAREAIELAASTDFLTLRGDAFLDLATVFEVGGQAPEAATALSAGLELYNQKGNLVSAERARARLARIARHEA
jgi:ATP/maltotriose-dependent transcriptional regulator MalT